MEYIISFASILALLVLIVGCCTVFTNAIEHLGKMLNMGHGAVGCVLAAVGTALPETIVPLVAILGAYITGESVDVGSEIGVGAILGSPFLLVTLAMLVTGISLLFYSKMKQREKEINIDTTLLQRDLRFFALGYSIAILATFIDSKTIKIIIGCLLLLLYLIYVFRTILKSCAIDCEGEMEDLYLVSILKIKDKSPTVLIWTQVVISILFLIFFSHLFVENIKFVSQSLNVSPMIVSLLLAPVATELPEMFNSIIWVGKSKDTLAMSNISGAMVFQSCIPMSIGIFLTNWKFSQEAIFNIVLVYLAVIVLYINTVISKNKLNTKTLLISGTFYIVYIIYVAYKFII